MEQDIFIYYSLGSSNIDSFIFRHRFLILRLKFLKFKKTEMLQKNFQIGIDESTKF